MDAEQNKQGLVEKAVGRMIGGSIATTTTGGVQVVTGAEYGRTSYSEEPEKFYEQTRGARNTLDGAEYYAVSQGYLRGWVCMGQ